MQPIPRPVTNLHNSDQIIITVAYQRRHQDIPTYGRKGVWIFRNSDGKTVTMEGSYKVCATKVKEQFKENKLIFLSPDSIPVPLAKRNQP